MTAESDRESFAKLFNEESDALFRFSFWRTSDRELAKEFTQEAFARLWEAFMLGKNVPNPKGFLRLVTKRLIIDWYRKKKPSSLDQVEEGEDEPRLEPGDEYRAVEEMDTSVDAKRALDRLHELDEQYRDVVYLRFVEDLPPRDIALLLKITPNAVSVRLSRGIAELKIILGINSLPSSPQENE
jgi:RNA polymerase sigma-70 factor (ECF subfamily)